MRAGFVATGLIAAAATLALQSCSSKKSPTGPGIVVPPTADSTAVYVSAGADSATADGSIAHPYPRIQIAIYEAFSRGKRNVLIASGTYPGSITLVSKISVRGGFNPATWVRPASATPTVIEGGTTALTINGADSVTVEHVTIRSATSTVSSRNSIGVLILGNSDGVTLRNSRIEAAAGVAGADGADGFQRSMSAYQDPLEGESGSACPPFPQGGRPLRRSRRPRSPAPRCWAGRTGCSTRGRRHA